MSTGDVTVSAHRGASAYAPEHTVAAYDLAVEQGADRLELDVRPLADGTLAVVHDRTLLRTCGDPRAVARLRPADLLELDPDTRPLLLTDVLRRYADATRFLVELKEPCREDLGRLLEDVGACGVRERVTVQSFDHAALRRLRLADPDLPLSPLYVPRLPARWLRMDLARIAAWATSLAPWSGSVDAALVEAAHARGLRVHAYTVNDAAEMRRLVALGADGLITDVPDRVRAALALPLAA